jgi:amino acid adenylation domain-containing protein
MEKGWEQVVGVLGVLHSGAAYLPLDAALPAERLAELLADGEVALAVTQAQRVAGLQWPAGVRPVVVDAAPPEGGTLAPLRCAGGKAAEGELAYVIYTSGSTGKPKGVMIEQRSVVNTIADVNERFEVGPRDRVLALSSLSFDLSVYDVFGLLAAGGCVVLPGPDQLGDPAQWLQLVERHGVTVWNTVPAFMNMFVEYLAGSGRPWPSSLRLVLMSGDWIPLELPGRIASLAPRCRVVSLGGATEASIWSIGYPVERIDAGWKSVPYGTPLRNQRFHVLDDRLEDAPDWVPGQLYIGGAGLAAGYWKDPEKTRQSFVTHPVTGDRLYRTGDLGRYLPDGNIEFLGRRDLQVKVGGHRIELGEIESVLGQHPAVKEAAVLAVAAKEGAASSRERRLAAFAVTRDGETGAEALAAHLRRRLPAYMVPGVIRVLPALPLTGNGKVDRKALAATLAEAPAPRASAPQQAEGLRNRLFDLLASALGRGTLDPRASLLELGANSLDVVRIANRFERELGFRPGLQELIRFSTAEQLVAYYEEQIVRDATFGGAGGERAPRAASPAPGSTYDLVLDARERAAFRSAQHGIRRDGLRPSLPLPHVDTDDDAVARALARRTVRQFLGGPLSAEAFGGLLGALRQAQEGEKPRYRYGSAGGLYPVQAYLHLKPGAVAGLEGGTYYYHPRHHRLEQLRASAEIDRRVFTLSNQEIFDGCSFAIFLVGQLDAIGPLYGGLSRDLCLIEAGLISQLLETVAPARGIGLCQIGTCDFERIRPLFELGDSHHYLHCLLGGPTDPPGAWSGFQRRAAPSGSREAEVDTGTI